MSRSGDARGEHLRLGRLIRPLPAGTLTALVAPLLSHSVAAAGSFVQLAVGGSGGMLAYVFTAVPRSDRRAWIDAARRARRPVTTVSG